MPTLRWLTRDEDVRAAEKVPYRLLEEVEGLGYGDRDAGNMLIQGDNLEALKALLPYYAGQVKCIYIDPPYNTKAAISEHYDDNLEHAQWLAMMWPRLELLRELLAPDGLFVCSIDDRQGAYLTVILDEIFGRSNRLNTVAVKMSEASGVKMAHAEKRLPKLKEWLIIYTGGNKPPINIDPIPLSKWNDEYKTLLCGLTQDEIRELRELQSQETADEEIVGRCNAILARTRLESLANFFKENKVPKAEQERWKFENAYRIVQAVGSSSVYNLAKSSPKSGGAISAALSATGLVYFFKSDFDQTAKQPRVQIIFADDALLTHPGDFWTDIKTTGGVGQEGGVLFPNSKKPEKLVQKIVGLVTNPGDLVLDSFLGSGTTAAVAQKMGRRYIGIEMGDHAVTHCAPRLQKVIDGEQGGISQAQNWQGGGGFRFYRLGPPVFTEDGQIQPDIRFPILAAHIWFAETGSPWTEPQPLTPFLGVKGGHGYALLYNGILGDKSVSGGNVLTRKTLALIREGMGDFTGPLTVYGERTALSEATLKAEQIEFKQTPYDVKARK
ncbi:site-specific DNA-methyltransferase [Paracoccus aurantiacus]|uniref:site-specific DNA-methyltransferase (adenine-specific) n=1 Tax=Paracoccus aurantiacus TaxID=2599412 RepID=A0A5C6RNP8_9RHOB|nr:site-specific DNA-methyltransferase [Paracoccus aurantiacus]TXB63535.1 site-specific DNA-methyltransferase [Paracoccus aurantiacus]